MAVAPAHWRRGFLRLYLVVALPWALWWCYEAYDDHRIYAFHRDHVNAMDASPKADRRDYGTSDLLRYEFKQRRNTALMWLPVIPLGLPVFMVVFVWVRAGFRQSQK